MDVAYIMATQSCSDPKFLLKWFVDEEVASNAKCLKKFQGSVWMKICVITQIKKNINFLL